MGPSRRISSTTTTSGRPSSPCSTWLPSTVPLRTPQIAPFWSKNGHKWEEKDGVQEALEKITEEYNAVVGEKMELQACIRPHPRSRMLGRETGRWPHRGGVRGVPLCWVFASSCPDPSLPLSWASSQWHPSSAYVSRCVPSHPAPGPHLPLSHTPLGSTSPPFVVKALRPPSKHL